MKNKQNPQGKYAEQLCRNFPHTSTRQLAGLLIEQFPNHYKNIESARSTILTYRGLGNRRVLKDKITPKQNFEIPQSYNEKLKPYYFSESINKLLILSDIHIPYHCDESIELVCNYAIKQGVDAVFLNGDILDFYQLSFHEKDPRKISIAQELETGREFLKYLKNKFNTPIFYIQGNHENRLSRYLMSKAPQLLGIEEFQLNILLRFGEIGIEEIPYSTKVYFQNYLIEHGDKLKGSGGINPARTLLLKFKRPTICGHFHRTSYSHSVIYDDKTIFAYSTGCLCDTEPEYFPVNEWTKGALIIERTKNGEAIVNNFTINDIK